MNLTPEQQSIIASAPLKQSMMIRALAGCAKTTSLALLAAEIKPTSALAIAFGVKTKDELAARLPSWFEVKTLNSIGHSAWSSAIGKRCEVDRDKVASLLRPYALNEDSWRVVRSLVVAARHAGIAPKGTPGNGILPDDLDSWENLLDDFPSEVQIKIAREVLQKCVNLSYAGTLDYDDQCYMSALFGGSFKRYKLVLIDEAQDLSPLNLKMLARLAENRIIAVGDENQAIFGFRGADVNSMDNLRKLRPEWLDFTLSVTFRCPKAVVRRRNYFLPSFAAAPDAIEGEVIDRKGSWTWASVPQSGSVAVLCRNNAPLIAFSFKLLRLNIPFHFLGKDGSRTIKILAKKILPSSGTNEAFMLAVADWRFAESAALLEAKKESKLDALYDRADALSAIVESSGATTLDAVLKSIDLIFSKEGSVTLSTAHKAKGLEWDTVIHLDPWRIPSRWARNETDKRQEDNLLNVLETRTRNILFVANVDKFVGA